MDVVEDLLRDGLVIVRNSERFTYGHDAVLLTDFVKAKKGEKYIDIGCGTGILAILAHAKTGADFLCIDIEPECCRIAQKSVELNKLWEHIQVKCADARCINQSELGLFDGAVCNPPYFAAGTKSPHESRLVSAFEESLSLEQAVNCAARMVKNGGKLYMCYPAKSIAPLCHALEKAHFALKRLCLVSSKPDKEPYLALAEAKHRGGAGASITYMVLENDKEGA